ncbi:4-hydroxy-tetrahydrodipicolinate reductase [Enterobacteriaceae endosymbiont of Plateumaris consimilis]|uniref:4-hydroxy-tetrahydrodipicolinate reductase n=1 Tax=Enterobacteriaceae endosymbiont of Plateumaris consimilis TaxID=2675794 RepID=UPI0014498B8E|nr:4-hydroxy-tetrahydrodipicolinate reductase [Enterobacteriaceae endosymbiont of Plateumaris consimilis]QJC28479.1 4-hydroxy-tetrahydrodipicolinate reductase [Enterobacteriaceae endosymbiont of Plateumaris consimilis]
MKNKVRLAISGINGRMGKNLLTIINQNQYNCVLNGILESKKSLVINDNIQYTFNKNILYNLYIQDNIINIIDDFDTLIDFTNPKSTLNYINICSQYNKNIVIGTTGFTEKEKIQIKKMSNKIGIVMSSNFSIGINIIFTILKNISKIFNKQKNIIDIDIIEKHHKNKIDCPSGTALSIKNIISNYFNHKIFNKVNCHSIRAGDIYGEHQIILSSIGEQIELIHKASNRLTFAEGALKAAVWISNIQKKGIYDMCDVLEL